MISIHSIKSILDEFNSIFSYKITEKHFKQNHKKSEDVIKTDLNSTFKHKNIPEDNLNQLEELNIRLSSAHDVISQTKRKMLVFLNPFGGSGKALKIWNSVFLIFGKYEI